MSTYPPCDVRLTSWLSSLSAEINVTRCRIASKWVVESSSIDGKQLVTLAYPGALQLAANIGPTGRQPRQARNTTTSTDQTTINSLATSHAVPFFHGTKRKRMILLRLSPDRVSQILLLLCNARSRLLGLAAYFGSCTGFLRL